MRRTAGCVRRRRCVAVSERMKEGGKPKIQKVVAYLNNLRFRSGHLPVLFEEKVERPSVVSVSDREDDAMKARCVIVTLASQVLDCKYQTKLSQISPNFRVDLVVLFIGGRWVASHWSRLEGLELCV